MIEIKNKPKYKLENLLYERIQTKESTLAKLTKLDDEIRAIEEELYKR